MQPAAQPLCVSLVGLAACCIFPTLKMYLSKLLSLCVQTLKCFGFQKDTIPEGKPGEEESDGDGKENCVRFSLSRNKAWQGDSIALKLYFYSRQDVFV